MAQLPDSGYLSDPTRTKGEMKTAFEDQRDFIEQQPGGWGDVVPNHFISAGSIAPTAGVVTVSPEGGVAGDFLTHIDPSAYSNGAMLCVLATNGQNAVFVKGWQGGTGQIGLRSVGSSPASTPDFPLEDTGSSILLVLSGTVWIEIARQWPRDDTPGGGTPSAATLIEWLRLGSLARYANGVVGETFGQTDVDRLGGKLAAEYRLASDPVGDADTLDGLHASDFVQIALTAIQTIASSLRSNTGRFVARSVQGGAPGVELIIDDGDGTPPTSDQLRALLYTTEGARDAVYLRLLDLDGSTVLGEVRVADDGDGTGSIEFDARDGGGFRDLRDAPLLNGEGNDEVAARAWEAPTLLTFDDAFQLDVSKDDEPWDNPDDEDADPPEYAGTYELPLKCVWWCYKARSSSGAGTFGTTVWYTTDNENGTGAPSAGPGPMRLYFRNPGNRAWVRVYGQYLP